MNFTNKELDEFKRRVISMMEGIPNIHEMMVNPSIFTNGPVESARMDCDDCPASQSNTSDCFDPGVCRDCWRNAIKNYKPNI